jgi:hypothetical protein
MFLNNSKQKIKILEKKCQVNWINWQTNQKAQLKAMNQA